MNVKPLIYGYLRADLGQHASQLEEWERQIHEFAGAEGFDVGTVFQEPPDLTWSAFASLMVELKRSECHDVAVPGLSHMLRPGSASPNTLVELLRAEAHAFVWVADPASRHLGMNTTEPMLRNGG
ncbi:hypothetical protein [Nocardia salmonicida]|uniref:hypothetical protein n=1 Tax=Nocardia salmonicida TaxID=53431 RepID=UPI0007A50ADD|nr:hypothetical protein [Nocardia salmonicida]